MLNTKSWLADTTSEKFDQVVQSVWSKLKEQFFDLPTLPPEGAGEILGEPWPVSYAYDPSAKFLALQWHALLAGSDKDSRVELAFVSPRSTKPKLCLRIYAQLPQPEIAVPEWVKACFNAPLTDADSIALPGFVELVALLAANGDVATTSATAFAQLAHSEQEVSYYKSLVQDLSDENRLLRAKNRDLLVSHTLAVRNTDQADAPDEAEAAEIKDLSGLPDWAEQNEARIRVLPRALNASKKSLYENPAAVYSALEILAGPYREHRRGNLNKEDFYRILAEAGFQLEGSVAPSVAGSHGDTYFVQVDGRRRFLELHIIKGGGRDERYCLRVYFYWDVEAQKVVVGWLPSHLSNSLS